MLRLARRICTGVAAVALATACTAGSGGDGEEAAAPASPPATAVDLTGLSVSRAPFCDLVDEQAVRAAIRGRVRGTNHYNSGDEAEINPGYVDVAHEYNCTYAGRQPAQARAWVFAAPVARARARHLVRSARSEAGCAPVDGLAFGAPTVTVVCRVERPRAALRVRMQGLFGDAWLGCEVTAPRPGPAARHERRLQRRADRWCVEVATTVGARP